MDDLRTSLLDSALAVVAIKSAFFFGFEQFEVKLLRWVDAGAVDARAEQGVVSAGVTNAVDFDEALSEGEPMLRGKGALFEVAN